MTAAPAEIALAALAVDCGQDHAAAALLTLPEQALADPSVRRLRRALLKLKEDRITPTPALLKAAAPEAVDRILTEGDALKSWNDSPETLAHTIRTQAALRLARDVYDAGLKGELSPLEAAAKLKELSAPPPGAWPDVDDACTLLAKPPARPPQLIEGVLYRGGKLNINGPSKARKTFFQLHLAACVATGTKWFGNNIVRGRCLYVNLELVPFSFYDRLGKICNVLNVKIEPGFFDALHLRGCRPSVEELEKHLREATNGKDYSLVFFDPLYKILGLRDENAAGDMGDLLNRLESIGRDAGAAVAFAHHFAKGSAAAKETLDRGSGSGVLARDGDTIITLTPHEDEDCLTIETILRDFPEVPPAVLRWRYPLFETDSTLNPADLRQAGNKKKPDITTDDVLRAASAMPQKREDLINAVMAATGRGFQACRAAVTEVVQRGLLDKIVLARPGVRPENLYARKGS